METITLPVPALTTLTEDESAFQQAVREFAEAEIRPLAADADEKQEFPKPLIPKLFEMGVMGIEVPEAHGGAGCNFFMSVLAVEEISRADPAVGVFVDVQNTLVVNALMRWGNDAQKARYGRMLATNTVGAYALSEAGSGSDAFALKCSAKDEGDHWSLTGQKLWITSAQEAGVFIVFATVNPEAGYKGITAFLVERDFPGFQVGKKENKLGIRASSTCEILLENCKVPKENVLGEVGKGYKVSIETLNEGRIGIGAQMVGLCRGALEAAVGYAREREQFGKPITGFQGVQFQVAEMASEIEAAKLLTYNAARLRDAGKPFVSEAAMAKWFSSQVAERVTGRCIEIFGGVGYTKDYPAEKYYRDAKIGQIYEGTSNMQLATIAKLIIGK
ncbi:MAG: acyl-CoA dehydrogenase [Acidobacteriota bacterium]|jgi:alkylation response protein AidB-like acyl-CoA dehydrogenase